MKAQNKKIDMKFIGYDLSRGAHYSYEPDYKHKFCAIEAYNHSLGRDPTDRAVGVSNVIQQLIILANDTLPSNTDRNRLLLPLLSYIGNTNQKRFEKTRRQMLAEWCFRTRLLIFCRAAKLEAGIVKNLPPLDPKNNTSIDLYKSTYKSILKLISEGNNFSKANLSSPSLSLSKTKLVFNRIAKSSVHLMGEYSKLKIINLKKLSTITNQIINTAIRQSTTNPNKIIAELEDSFTDLITQMCSLSM